MNESVMRREAIVKRLMSLNLSAENELKDIVQLTAAICQTPDVFISLPGREKQPPVSIGSGKEYAEIETFLRSQALPQNEMTEVPEIGSDERFRGKDLRIRNEPVMFYAGVPLRTQCGEALGTLCIVDTKPGSLTHLQKNCLPVIARQITIVLEFESGLSILKEEIGKVQDSEIKLKSMFQSSPDMYLLIGKDFRIKAFNKAASVFSAFFCENTMNEGDDFRNLVKPETMDSFLQLFEKTLSGQPVTIDRRVSHENKKDVWWQAKYSPVYNHLNEIIGVAINITDITDILRDKDSIMAQNLALKKIAQIQSHELRRPVANIIELTGILSDKEDKDFSLHLSYLKNEVRSLDEKIHQIVELSSNHHKTSNGYVASFQQGNPD